MYDAKEQARLYLDRIKTITKSTNTTLLLFVPLIVLLLLEIQKHSGLVELQTDGRSERFAIANRQDTLNKRIRETSEGLTALIDSVPILKLTSADTNVVKAKIGEAKIRIADYAQQRRKLKSDKQKTTSKTKALNDSLKTQLEQLKIAVELPIVRRTENFSIRTVVVVTMAILTLLLWHLLRSKQNVSHYLDKFLRIQKHASFQRSDIFRNHTLDLPFWVFPLAARQFGISEPREVAQVVGTNNKGLANRNWFLFFALSLFLLLNFFCAD